ERLDGFLLFAVDVEEFVELGDLENFVDLVADVAEDEAAPGLRQLLVQGDQLGQGGAGEVLDVGEIEQELAAAYLVHETEELLADDLDVLLVEDLPVREVDHGDITDIFHFEAPATRLGRHRLASFSLPDRPARSA